LLLTATDAVEGGGFTANAYITLLSTAAAAVEGGGFTANAYITLLLTATDEGRGVILFPQQILLLRKLTKALLRAGKAPLL